MTQVIVVGAGLGGIAAALRLRTRGYQVTVVERNADIGGRAAVIKREGYTFDAGPTVVTAPFLFAELFQLFDKDINDYVVLKPLSTWYRFIFSDGGHFDYGGSEQAIYAEVSRVSPTDLAGYKRMLDFSRRTFDKAFIELAAVPFASLWKFITLLPTFFRLRLHRSVFAMTKRFIKHPQLRKVFSMQPLLVGGNPLRTTAAYHMIHYLEHKWGVHYPQGGVAALIAALKRLMLEQGIELCLQATVTEIIVRNKQICGVRLADGRLFEAPIVIANADAPYLYRHLLKPSWLDRMLLKRWRYSMGVFICYFGTRRQYPDVQQHTVVLCDRYQAALRDIFQRKVLADEMSIYLHRPTATDPSLAPPGCDGFYALVPVPNLQADIDWQQTGPLFRDRLLQELERLVLPDLRACITTESFVTPQHFAERYLSLFGTGFSIQPLLSQSICFRFHNRSKIAGLYLVGAGTHPGAGMPGVLSSAKVLEHFFEPITAV